MSNLVEHTMMRVRTEKALARKEKEQGRGHGVEDVEKALKRMEDLTGVLHVMQGMEGREAPALFSFLAACQVGAGSPEYFRNLEDGFLRIATFHDDFKERIEMEQQRGGEMKNRAMQYAARDYTEILALMESHPDTFEDEIVKIHANVSRYFYTLPDLVTVEVDDSRQRVNIYIQSAADIRENAMDEYVAMQEWTLEPGGVLFTEVYHIAAVRVVKELISEAVIPQGYSVVVTGHSAGGGIACIVAAYLQEEHNINILNVVTFGQPKISTTVGNPALTALPILRITTPLDGFIDTPTGSADHHPFLHYGEHLSLLPSQLRDIATPEWIDENLVYVTMNEYHKLLADSQAVITYEDQPSMVSNFHGYGDITMQDEEEVPWVERKQHRKYHKSKDRLTQSVRSK
eukprot:TRINITY_DN42611_c0_g1_i1.p1 TRINITY_DN42611_c0_g1~~TRINITY_DN42611_c0_g1_i1.p1  ORF type:complete len:440 (+),score=98.18 TRINITY_DN42611_c0_g1_i1:115-1320(+)